MTMKKFLKAIQLAEVVVGFIETILHVKFIGAVMHDMNNDKREMLHVLDSMASLVDTVGTSQFFTKQLWKDVYPDATTREVLSIFITSELYDHGVYAHYGPKGLLLSDKWHISSFLNEHREVLEKYYKWSRGGQR